MSNIPKVIHYCWFGRGEFSELIRMCIDSWKRYLPEYKIIEWNEDNFDIHKNKYIEEAYNSKKWAFVSDYVRLYVIYHYGGLYFDTDVEILKSLDIFLNDHAFSGFEANDSVPTAVMGCEKGHEFIGELLRYYDDKNFIKSDGTFDMTTNTTIMTRIFLKEGLKSNGEEQMINNFVLYPQIVFAPNSISRVFGANSSRSYAIHHFDSSWRDKKIKKSGITFRLKRYLVGIMRNTIGTNKTVFIKKKLKL